MKSPSPSSAPSPSPHPTSDIAHPTSLDALAEALTTTRPLADIAAEHNLNIAQLSALAKTPALAERIAAITALHALHDAAIIREQIAKLREISNTTDSPIEARRASTTIIRYSAIMARIAAGHNKRAPANLRAAAGSSKPLPEGGVGVGSYDTVSQAAGPEAKHLNGSVSSRSFTPSPTHPPTPSLPPPPKPYSSPDLLFPHQIHLLRTHKPPTPHQAFQTIYETLDHPIKCNGDLQELFKAKLINSTLLNHYTADFEDLGPPSFDQEVLIPAPISPDLSLKPVLKHFAIKRYAFTRENQTPLYLRVHLAKQDLVKGETADRWYLADLAIDSS